MAVTRTAWGPLAPCSTSNWTRWFSSRVRKPLPWISEKCTKTSFAPSSGVMKPKPLSPLNHFTVPCAIYLLFHSMRMYQKHPRITVAVLGEFSDPVASKLGVRSRRIKARVSLRWLSWSYEASAPHLRVAAGVVCHHPDSAVGRAVGIASNTTHEFDQPASFAH